jgi:hypothetical protein
MWTHLVKRSIYMGIGERGRPKATRSKIGVIFRLALSEQTYTLVCDWAPVDSATRLTNRSPTLHVLRLYRQQAGVYTSDSFAQSSHRNFG